MDQAVNGSPPSNDEPDGDDEPKRDATVANIAKRHRLLTHVVPETFYSYLYFYAVS